MRFDLVDGELEPSVRDRIQNRTHLGIYRSIHLKVIEMPIEASKTPHFAF